MYPERPRYDGTVMCKEASEAAGDESHLVVLSPSTHADALEPLGRKKASSEGRRTSQFVIRAGTYALEKSVDRSFISERLSVRPVPGRTSRTNRPYARQAWTCGVARASAVPV